MIRAMSENMSNVPQNEVDKIVFRIRIVSDRYGGWSDALGNLRELYRKFYDNPDREALIALDEETKKFEDEMRSLNLYPEGI